MFGDLVLPQYLQLRTVLITTSIRSYLGGKRSHGAHRIQLLETKISNSEVSSVVYIWFVQRVQLPSGCVFSDVLAHSTYPPVGGRLSEKQRLQK